MKTVDQLADEWAEAHYKTWEGSPDPISGYSSDNLEGGMAAAYKAGYAQADKAPEKWSPYSSSPPYSPYPQDYLVLASKKGNYLLEGYNIAYLMVASFDSGGQKWTQKTYFGESPVLIDVWAWSECPKMPQLKELAKGPKEGKE